MRYCAGWATQRKREENDVRRAYMHAAEFWNERVEMMQVWADYLDQLRHGSSTDQGVQPFARSQR
jgi:hypothetical protein